MITVDEDKLRALISDQFKPFLEYVKDIAVEISQIKLRLDSIENRLAKVEDMLKMHEADIIFLYKKIA